MFKILELSFISHPLFKNLNIKFVSDGEENEKNYTTLIIGPNGTGKSKILLSIISIFNSLERLTEKDIKYSHEFKYILRFQNFGTEYLLDYSTQNLLINNDSFFLHINDLKLPSKILVSAFSFNDKYPIREQRGKITNQNYYYLGLKSTTNNIFLGNPTKNAIQNLYNALINNKDISPLKQAFKVLELKPNLTLTYKAGKNFNFLRDAGYEIRKEITQNEFSNSFQSFLNKKRKNTAYPELKRLGFDKINRILNDTETGAFLMDYLSDNIGVITNTYKKEILIKPSLNLEDNNSLANFSYHVKGLQLLSDLEIISFKQFQIAKNNDPFSFDDASSGEYHIIITFLNILSLIEENSLIILDEPEISLHPNWQIKYLHIFNKIFSSFPTCHYIFATHSHFLVSDLKSENSNILAVDIENGEIMINETPKNTYGWSAEQILLDVFKVATTRNYYLTRLVGEILNKISKEKFEKKDIADDILKLKELDIENLNENDPMKIVIEKILTKIDN